MIEADAEKHLRDDSHDDDRDRDRRIRRLTRFDDLLNGLAKREKTRNQDDDSDDDRSEVFDAPIPKGVMPVRTARSKLRAHDGDDGRERIGSVVHAIEDDSDRMREEPDNELESNQEHIAHDADDARFDYLVIAST